MAAGSSPLTRGKHARFVGELGRGRLIPAHAGKTPLRLRSSAAAAAHPRSRGENGPRKTASSPNSGSSPLTRGKHARALDRLAGERLIPAHAGKTTALKSSYLKATAHPRSRGENAAASAASLTMRGSSPLTRGKQDVLSGERGHGRLIPAHAGKTAPKGASPAALRAHPRSRGENLHAAEGADGLTGSSPLTRGKPHRSAWPVRPPRLIPAHAGKTSVANLTEERSKAHPRSRGENSSAVRAPTQASGSSPLTRGKHRHRMDQRRPIRLIPAHAGKTSSYDMGVQSPAAHPRSRGENVPSLSVKGKPAGSSPLTRGKPS